MEDRSWMYDGAGGDPLLYFKHVTQFVEATKTHALPMNKIEIWCPCRNCENNVLWTTTETICEHLLEKGSLDNYSIWTKHGETEENAQGNGTEQERKLAIMILLMCSMIVMVVKVLMWKNCHTILSTRSAQHSQDKFELKNQNIYGVKNKKRNGKNKISIGHADVNTAQH
jgi:hypothetical protein